MTVPDEKLKWFFGACVSVIFAVQFGSKTELGKEKVAFRYCLYATGILTIGLGVLVCFRYKTVSQHPWLHKQFGPFVPPIINTAIAFSIMGVVSFNEKSIESILFFYGGAFAVFSTKHFIGCTWDLGIYNFMVFAALAQAYLLDESYAGSYVMCGTVMTSFLLYLNAEIPCVPATTVSVKEKDQVRRVPKVTAATGAG